MTTGRINQVSKINFPQLSLKKTEF